MKLSTRGKGHNALAILADAPATLGALRLASGLTGHKARKLGFLLGMLRDRGLVTQDGPGMAYEITDAGREALAALNSGEDFPVAEAVPGVRMFGRAA